MQGSAWSRPILIQRSYPTPPQYPTQWRRFVGNENGECRATYQALKTLVTRVEF
jgi:hypothetical protein